MKQVALGTSILVLHYESGGSQMETLITRCRWNRDRCFWTFFTDKIVGELQFAVNVHASSCLNIEVELPFTMLLSMVMKKPWFTGVRVVEMDAGT